MAIVLQLITIACALAGAFMWIANTISHRRHLSQCEQDLQRHRRLDKRLIGCVTDIEHILDRMPPQETGELTIPEELAGHARFLYGLRQEAGDNAINLSRHAVRLQWSDAYLSKATLAGRRCELAHGALVVAFQAMADATREYERGLSIALLRSGDGPEARAMTAPVRLLDESAAVEVARLREVCGRALVNAACHLRFETSAVFDTKWLSLPGES
jgi:hypothetical protein